MPAGSVVTPAVDTPFWCISVKSVRVSGRASERGKRWKIIGCVSGDQYARLSAMISSTQANDQQSRRHAKSTASPCSYSLAASFVGTKPMIPLERYSISTLKLNLFTRCVSSHTIRNAAKLHRVQKKETKRVFFHITFENLCSPYNGIAL